MPQIIPASVPMTADPSFACAVADKRAHVVNLRDGTGPSVICFPGAGGYTHVFLELVRALPPGHPVRAINLEWLCDETRDFTIEQLATYYVDLVRSLQEDGPCVLCGYSFGGLLAYELAARLAAEGHDVAAVALLDAPNPALTANLSSSETAQFHKRYLIDRLGRYRDHLLRGDIRAFVHRGLNFVVSRLLKPVVPVLKTMARLTGRPLPSVVRSNDPGFLRAWSVYVPKPHPVNVVCFRVEDRGDEHQRDPSMGWSNCALGGLEVLVVPGGHIDMMMMPSVQVVADALARLLRDGVSRQQQPPSYDLDRVGIVRSNALP